MLNKMKIFMAVAVLSGTVSANVLAAPEPVQNGNTLNLSQVNHTSIEDTQQANHLMTSLIHTGDTPTIATVQSDTMKQSGTLMNLTANPHGAVLQKNNLIAGLVHLGLNLVSSNSSNPAGTNSPINQAAAIASAVSPGNTQTDTVTQIAAQASQQAASAGQPTAVTQQPADSGQQQSTPDQQQDDTAQQTAAPAPQQQQDDTTQQTAAPAQQQAAADQQPAAPAKQQAAPAQQQDDSGQKVITVKATAYTASCAGCSGTTATGINIKDNPNAKVIAVDPNVIPLGSKVYVEGFGEATAADTGGAIKGNRIDVFIPSEQGAMDFGVKRLKVTILN